MAKLTRKERLKRRAERGAAREAKAPPALTLDPAKAKAFPMSKAQHRAIYEITRRAEAQSAQIAREAAAEIDEILAEAKEMLGLAPGTPLLANGSLGVFMVFDPPAAPAAASTEAGAPDSAKAPKTEKE